MKLVGKLIIGTKMVGEALVEKNDNNMSFRDLLEDCLLSLCRELDIPVPLWLKKNTSEFAAYHRTFFSREQFMEKVYFDRFEIRFEP